MKIEASKFVSIGRIRSNLIEISSVRFIYNLKMLIIKYIRSNYLFSSISILITFPSYGNLVVSLYS
jgi:hypothetical protein